MTPDEIITTYFEMMDSLNKAVKSAGGSEFTRERLVKMNAFELITHLCTNGIRFTCTHSEKVEENIPVYVCEECGSTDVTVKLPHLICYKCRHITVYER